MNCCLLYSASVHLHLLHCPKYRINSFSVFILYNLSFFQSSQVLRDYRTQTTQMDCQYQYQYQYLFYLVSFLLLIPTLYYVCYNFFDPPAKALNVQSSDSQSINLGSNNLPLNNGFSNNFGKKRKKEDKEKGSIKQPTSQ